jgi:RNA polymerase sigma-70 factor (ECF subfamily)
MGSGRVKHVLQDKRLILRFRHGSQEAFCRIYEKYRDDLLRLAVSLLKDKSAAEDVLQEVFVRLIAGRRSFELTGSLRAYLATCVANRARNINRDNRRGVRLDSAEPAAMPCESRRPDRWAVCSEEFDKLRAAMLDLPYEQREVLALRVYGQLTFREIAALREVSIKTAQSRYTYALDKLRLVLDGEVKV